MPRETSRDGCGRSAHEAAATHRGAPSKRTRLFAAGSARCGEPKRKSPAFAVVLALIAFGGFTACRSEADARRARQWTRCTCSYISDFDEPGRAPIDVCTEARDAEEVAAACVRNDGVGIPTSCACETAPKGPCEKSDRCRQASNAR